MKTKKYLFQLKSLIIIGLGILLINSCQKTEENPQTETTSPIPLEEGLVTSYNFSNSMLNSKSGKPSIDSVNSLNYSFVNDRKNNASRAIEFTGNGYLQLRDDTTFRLNFPFTISMWVYLEDSSSTSNRLFYSDPGGGIYYGFWLQTTGTNGEMALNYGNGIGTGSAYRYTAISSLKLRSKRWQHIVAIFKNATTIEYYLNGVADTNLSYSGDANEIVYSGNPGYIGYIPGSYLTGKIDNIRIWKRAITSDNAKEEYQRNN